LTDIPWRRTLNGGLLARWAQARDIGVLFGNITAFSIGYSGCSNRVFIEAICRIPLGFGSKAVKHYALRQMHATQNRTLVSRWVHDINAGSPGNDAARVS
jgi:hypothetical protein